MKKADFAPEKSLLQSFDRARKEESGDRLACTGCSLCFVSNYLTVPGVALFLREESKRAVCKARSAARHGAALSLPAVLGSSVPVSSVVLRVPFLN